MKAIFPILALLLLVPIAAQTRCKKPPIKIAVLDTGFGFHDRGREAKLCQFGHRDFTGENVYVKDFFTVAPVPQDFHGHGTNIVGIIDGLARESARDYCIVVIKVFGIRYTEEESMRSSENAIRYAVNLGVDMINYSAGGSGKTVTEEIYVKRFLDQGGIFVAAAGNEGIDLDKPKTRYYPAMYDPRIVVVGNLGKDGNRMPKSNYGSAVDRWETGEDVRAFGLTMTGTSQATAVATGKLVSEKSFKRAKQCDIRRSTK